MLYNTLDQPDWNAKERLARAIQVPCGITSIISRLHYNL